ncbi:hypothetical protein TSUD_185280 [Trifolium subterraneum]|uniref:Uncharacterized protein n=1 Tax=Trifolium subterraneum TaxID=3900 RepID=A0A2Z6NVG7_TRISU|nr:hypothetical protein TSUD_185280 [Trifolium subterraneum]
MICGEKSSVDIVYDDVADIAHGKGDVHIKVKVIRLWKVSAFLNPSEFNSIEMVLMDGKRATLLLGSNHISSW